MTERIVAQIHARTLEVLKEVGLEWPHEPSLQALAKQGFAVDHASRRVRISPDQVEQTLEAAPRDMPLYGRDQAVRLSFDHGPLLMGAGTIPAIVDLVTQQRRPATALDVVWLSRIQDALPYTDIPRPIVTARDVPQRHSSLLEYALSLCNTTKHVHHRILAPEDVELLMEIGVAITGSARRLRERPIFSGCYCPLSPLSYTPENVACMLGYARYGVPFQILSQTIFGANSPPSVLGPVIVANAEVVGTIAILQALAPGLPLMYGGILTPMDMRTGLVTYGTPELGALNALAGKMARHYGFVNVLSALRTDAKQCDVQAGFEKAMNLWPVLPVVDIVYGAGNLDTGLTCGYDQLVLDDELMSAARRQMGFQPNGNGRFEVDLIKRVGPKGNFLKLKRTAEEARGFWYPRFFVRGDYDAWAAKRTDAAAQARAKAQEIIATHRPAPLPSEVVAAIKEIVSRRIDRELVERAFA